METLQRPWEHAQLARYIPSSARVVLDCTPDEAFAASAGVEGRRLTGLSLDGSPHSALKGFDEITLVDLDAPEFPFADDEVDCVVCDDALASARDAEPLLREIARVLVPGGLAVVTVPNLQYHRNVAALAEGRWEMGTSLALAREHLRYFTAYEIAMLLQRTGLRSPACEVLAGDRPDDVPLNEEQCIVHGRVSIGPIGRDEYAAALAQQYLVLAAKPAAD